MDTLVEIEARIVILEQSLAQLRRQRNAFMALCRLPIEILVIIYQHTQVGPPLRTRLGGPIRVVSTNHETNPIEDFFEDQTSYKHIDKNWVSLMLTCAHLREVAVAARELWRHIRIPRKAEWNNICLARAQGLPLYLHAGISSRNIIHTQQDIFVRSLRQAVHASVEADSSGDDAYYTGLKEGLNQQCGSLKRLRLVCRSNHMEAAAGYTITDQSLAGSSTTLTTLQLAIDTITSWPNLPNLCHVSIKIPCISSFVIMITGLSGCQQLEILNIDMRTFSSPSMDSAQVKNIVDLRSLRILRVLAFDLQNISFLLDSIPKPRWGLHIDTSSHSRYRSTLRNRASAEEVKAYVDVMRYVSQFWNACSSDLLSIGVLYSTAPTSETTFHCTSSPDFENYSDISEPFCDFSASHCGNNPLMDSIKTLVVSGDRAGPAGLEKGGEDTGNMALMHIDALQIRNASTEVHINLLGKWLKARNNEGKPVRVLQISKQATHKAWQSLQDLGARLKKQRVIEEVELMC